MEPIGRAPEPSVAAVYSTAPARENRAPTSSYDKDERMAKSLGATGYLTKPPQLTQLKGIIDRCQDLSLSQEGNGFALRRAA